MLLSLVAYQVQHWRYLTLLISMLGLPFLSYHWLLPESPRWLLCQKRIAEAVTVLEDIARGNGSVLSESVKHDLATDEEIVQDNEGLLDLFRPCELGLVTVIQLYSWLVNGAVCLGLTLAAGRAGASLVDIVYSILANRWHRRRGAVLRHSSKWAGGAACLPADLQTPGVSWP